MKKKPNIDKYIKLATKIKNTAWPYCTFEIFDGKRNRAIKTFFYVKFNPEAFYIQLNPDHQTKTLNNIRDKITEVFTKRKINPDEGYEICPKCKGYKCVIQYQEHRYGWDWSITESEKKANKRTELKLRTNFDIDNCDYCDLKGQIDFIQFITKTKKDKNGRIIQIDLIGDL